MKLVALPAFTDNYIWMLHDGRSAIVVDPGAAAPVTQALHEQGLKLVGILVTHHHVDHVGGVDELRSQLKGPVIGPGTECAAWCDTVAKAGDRLNLLDLQFSVMEVPGHTKGHLAYFCPDAQTESSSGILFCGDTLFSAGCGRLFEGTMDQLKHSLDQLAALPGNTLVCCAHEYTLSNLRFAQAVEPDNPMLSSYIEQCQSLRQQGRPTLPSTLEVELQVNPFLRCQIAQVKASALNHGALSADPSDIFSALRSWKDTFR